MRLDHQERNFKKLNHHLDNIRLINTNYVKKRLKHTSKCNTELTNAMIKSQMQRETTATSPAT